MAYVKIVIFTLIAGYLCGLLLKTLLAAFRTGSIRYIDSQRPCDRATRPAAFWALTAFFSALFLLLAATWTWAVLDTLGE